MWIRVAVAGCQLHSRGDVHALDNLCDSTGHVVARIGQFVHVGWIHPHSVGDRRCGAPNQSDHGAQAGALRANLSERFPCTNTMNGGTKISFPGGRVMIKRSRFAALLSLVTLLGSLAWATAKEDSVE